ncbi:molybdenum ABC transporter ATP-binding protein [Pseudomonas sp. CDFA 602]|uniref:molybdenum ABC transporter ATP-binding protein n=1 Tax=Pseudomonas californiensis TaxID=2829823 RepID=UPI001E357E2E|nr:molybdenum ABC transporter ATP-binding protein [Pseudomonas californiensis]MCD5994126.1 molybdenum ABC transporter ATP-binding protein [Pseudomonas californiensis]MCD5999775.1 molybdenum ABC transporter ATP-binding protein [Pseudomonas californiensis]
MASTIEVRLQMTYPEFSVDVDLVLPGTGVTALYGPSGSGKTTCLRCIAGLEQTANGFLRVHGEIWQDTDKAVFVPAHKRAIGYVFQEASLFAHLSVRANLEFGLKRIPRNQRSIELRHATELLGIDHLLERRPEKLSGGERQRVGIARALLTSPRLLLLDEPLAALDARRKNEILPYLDRLQRELDIPMLYVSHAQDEVARLADHLVLLEAGKVVASGPIQETLARLDLPLAMDDDAGVVIEGMVTAYDTAYQLLTLGLPASSLALRVAHAAMQPGTRLRVKVQARDVSLSLQADDPTSILNRLPVTVVDEAIADNSAHVLVRLDAGGTPLLARLTRYSYDQLKLHRGQAVWAQIKAAAVLA